MTNLRAVLNVVGKKVPKENSKALKDGKKPKFGYTFLNGVRPSKNSLFSDDVTTVQYFSEEDYNFSFMEEVNAIVDITEMSVFNADNKPTGEKKMLIKIVSLEYQPKLKV